MENLISFVNVFYSVAPDPEQMKGMKEVVDEYTVPGYNVGHYKAPGSTE